MIAQKNNYNAVDLVKSIMAIGVVMIHRHIFPQDQVFANYMLSTIGFSIAVPFFFISSSFFFFRNSFLQNKTPKKLLPYLKRLFILYFIWTIIYLPCIFVKNHTGHYNEITINGLIGQSLVLVKDFFFSYSFLHFWYITTLILSVTVVYLLRKKFSVVVTVAICLSLIVLWFFFDFFAAEGVSVFQTIHDFLPVVFKNSLGDTESTSGYGLLSIVLGLVAAKYSEFINKKFSAVFFIICAVAMLLLGSITFQNPVAFLVFLRNIFTALTSFFLFNLCLKIDLKPSPVYKKLRDCSILIYFSHLLIMKEGYNYIAAVTGISAFVDSNILRFSVTLVFSVLFSSIILRLSQNKLKFLKYLY